MIGDETTETLVVGAGPVGMMTALLLARNGIRIKVIDREPGTATQSYACALHPATLEKLVSKRAPWFPSNAGEIDWSSQVQLQPGISRKFGLGRCWLAGDSPCCPMASTFSSAAHSILWAAWPGLVSLHLASRLPIHHKSFQVPSNSCPQARFSFPSALQPASLSPCRRPLILRIGATSRLRRRLQIWFHFRSRASPTRGASTAL